MTDTPASMVKPGIYKHYKGNLYRVINVCKHTETEEELVHYQSINDGLYWVRPVEMFKEQVMYDGQLVDRFTFIEDQ